MRLTKHDMQQLHEVEALIKENLQVKPESCRHVLLTDRAHVNDAYHVFKNGAGFSKKMVCKCGDKT
jgi:hypothetical protein